MRIGVEVSGGIGGLRLEGTLDTEGLPADLGSRAERSLTPDRLAPAATRSGEPVPDERQWRVTVAGRAFDVVESRLDPDQVETLDALVSALVEQRRRDR